MWGGTPCSTTPAPSRRWAALRRHFRNIVCPCSASAARINLPILPSPGPRRLQRRDPLSPEPLTHDRLPSCCLDERADRAYARPVDAGTWPEMDARPETPPALCLPPPPAQTPLH